MRFLPFFLALKAEALYFADRTFEALEAIKEAETVVERSEGRWWCAELHRLRGVFLTAIGADETQIEVSYSAAISTAKRQKSISLAKRAEGSYAEYRRQHYRDMGSDYLFANAKKARRLTHRSTVERLQQCLVCLRGVGLGAEYAMSIGGTQIRFW